MLDNDKLSIKNPFGAPVYYKETVTSTMDAARLYKDGASGTVIAAGLQSAGRGRSGRPWSVNAAANNLYCTIMLRYGTFEKIPPCITLKTGLAVSLAIEDFAALVCGAPILAGRVKVKWPNDVMLLDKSGRGRKAVGILAEAEGGTVYIGIGINIARDAFPPELAGKASSIAQTIEEFSGEADALGPEDHRFTLLEMILSRLHHELESTRNDLEIPQSDQGSNHLSFRERLEDRLYMKGQRVCFIPGLPEELSPAGPVEIEGTLRGIGEGGELLITDDSGKTLSFVTGELKVYL
jgi:BirA family biotin operon repressor/biotin-[acetyl-CoA-carboxylase] ligase